MDESGAADDELLIRWTRALGYLTGQYRKLLKDTDIDEMEAEVESLAKELDADL